MKQILLVSAERTFLVDKERKQFQCDLGTVDVTKIKKMGQNIKTSKGHVFVAIEPTITDLLKRCKRGPQVVLPKDASAILSVTGFQPHWRCLDAGSGSGFLALFLGSFLATGKLTTYERNPKTAALVKDNVIFCGLEHVVTIKNKNVLEGFSEKRLDLVTLDMIDAEQMIPKVFAALSVGGWVVVYSPHIEQQKLVVQALQQHAFAQIHTIEQTQRQWQVSEYTHPVPSGIMHTGFLTFGRKLSI